MKMMIPQMMKMINNIRKFEFINIYEFYYIYRLLYYYYF